MGGGTGTGGRTAQELYDQAEAAWNELRVERAVLLPFLLDGTATMEEAYRYVNLGRRVSMEFGVMRTFASKIRETQ